jgi:regulator of protease activity HflC (stomatin/prohibitin superfamily)
MENVVLVVIFGAIAALIVRSLFTRIDIFEHERGLRYRHGKFVSVLGPGRSWVYKASTTVRRVDVRPTIVSIPGQEVVCSDGVSLKVSLAATYQVTDPATAINSVESYVQALYITLQIALREVVGQATIDEVLEGRDRLSERIMELTVEPVSVYGITLMGCDIKDIMFPGQLKKIFAQEVQARKEGLAALERARGETAALRNLANAARMVDANPALIQLRLLQQLGSQGGNTVVLGFPQGGTPLPLRASGDEGAPEIPPPPPESWDDGS